MLKLTTDTDGDVETLAGRLDRVFGRLRNEEVAERMTEAGLDTSKETVRRYRGGHAERITADFVAMTARLFGVDLEWLMTGVRRPNASADAILRELERKIEDLRGKFVGVSSPSKDDQQLGEHARKTRAVTDAPARKAAGAGTPSRRKGGRPARALDTGDP